MAKRKRKELNAIEPGMAVETTQGDLGEEDVSKPRVTEVERNGFGIVERLTVQKGVLFKKGLDVPVDRVQTVEGRGAEGKVLIDADEEETDALAPAGTERLAPEKEQQQKPEQERDFLDEVEEAIPTAEGLREMEGEAEERRARGERSLTARPVRLSPLQLLRQLGPGFLSGTAGNDSSSVATYALAGARAGYGYLWLLLLLIPLFQATQYACSKIGRITQQGLAEILCTHYGRRVAALASLTLIVANVALIAADLVAIGNGFELLTHISWVWFVIPIAALLWYLTVFRSFETLKKVFIVLSFVFIAYIITAVMARPDWNQVAFNTFVPHLDLSFSGISTALAVLGATIAPYNIFWQVQGEKEEQRPGSLKQQLNFTALDSLTGVLSSCLIAYFIIISTAATLHTQYRGITTAADAAQALVPVLGPFAGYLFALGLIGAGVVAIPILLASTSYAVAGTLSWSAGLSKKPWQSEGFYLIISGALVLSIIMALLHLDPIQLLFSANLLAGLLSPILVVYLLMVGNNQEIMRGHRLGRLTNIGLAITFLVMVAGVMLLLYGLFSGQNS